MYKIYVLQHYTANKNMSIIVIVPFLDEMAVIYFVKTLKIPMKCSGIINK